MMEIYSIPKEEPTPKEAIDFWKQNLKDQRFYNKSIDRYIYVTKDGIEKCMYGNRRQLSKIRMQLIFLIEYIIEKAEVVKIEEDVKNKTLHVFTLKTTAVINGNAYNIYIFLKEANNRTLYYYHTGTKITRERKR